MVAVSAWGRLSADDHRVQGLADPGQVAARLRDDLPGLAHGMGRSYGDVCLNPGGVLWNTTGMDCFIAFDQAHGVLRCESGTLLRDIQRLAVPRGWMLPVTPGTQLVTVGGAIANDVHGKNHHRFGTFGGHVRKLRLARTDGSLIECGPELESGWLAATVGGVGLTGVMLDVELQLRPVAGPWINQETIPFYDVDEFLALADPSVEAWEYTVAWVDCFTTREPRGIFIRGNHSDRRATDLPPERGLGVPFSPPFSLINRLSLQAFNRGYFHYHRARAGRSESHYRPFFYPLDALLEWNRIYGPRGFYQYQCVVPRSDGESAIDAIFDQINRHGEGSFLSVLKTFGEAVSPGLLSFPMPGITLALDFPNRGPATRRLFDRLDAVVAEAGGRLYLAKDARMPRPLFEAGYPRLDEFLAYRDPGISSALCRRLMES